MIRSLHSLLLLALLGLLTGCPTPSVVIDDDDATGDDDDATSDDDDATGDDDDATGDDDDATGDDDDSAGDDDDATGDDDDSAGDDDDATGDDDDATAPQWVAGDLVITEFLNNAVGLDDNKEWFELFNNSGVTIDLQDFTFYDDGGESFTVNSSVLVLDGDYVVLAQSSDTNVNGGLSPDYAYGLSQMTLGNSGDEIRIDAPDGTMIDSIVIDNGVAWPDSNGESQSLDPQFLDAVSNDNGLNWCAALGIDYGTNGDIGTPGTENLSCTPVGDDDDSAGDDDDSALGDDDDSALGDDDDSALGDDDDSALGDDDDSALGDDDDSALGDDDDSALGDDDDSALGDDDDSALGDDDDSALGDDDDSALGDDDDATGSNCDIDPWINELHYDNGGGDTDEGVELAGPAGTDLSGWTIELYNGSNGSMYGTATLSGTIADDGSGFGAVWVAQSGLQNGGADGLALIDPLGQVTYFLSYEGSLTATAGAANGMVSTDIGVFETGSTPVGDSLQLAGTGCGYADFVWQVPQPNTMGVVNTGQTFQP